MDDWMIEWVDAWVGDWLNLNCKCWQLHVASSFRRGKFVDVGMMECWDDEVGAPPSPRRFVARNLDVGMMECWNDQAVGDGPPSPRRFVREIYG
jgi:hypothetical protein